MTCLWPCGLELFHSSLWFVVSYLVQAEMANSELPTMASKLRGVSLRHVVLNGKLVPLWTSLLIVDWEKQPLMHWNSNNCAPGSWRRQSVIGGVSMVQVSNLVQLQLYVSALSQNHGYICCGCRLDNPGYCFVLVHNPVRHACVSRWVFLFFSWHWSVYNYLNLYCTRKLMMRHQQTCQFLVYGWNHSFYQLDIRKI